jgi:radical SAM peptide maturase (CXXX-repeat target family)
MIRKGSAQFSDIFPKYLDGSPGFAPSGGFAVKTLTFVVTEDCNLACSYCYESKKGKGRAMSKGVAKKAVDSLLEGGAISRYLDPDGDLRAVILEFIGGEPLLQADLIGWICDYFRWRSWSLGHQLRSYMVSMTTNGVLYGSPEAQRLVAANKGRLSMTITIDGNKELHDACRRFPDGRGSFGAALEAAKLAKAQLGLKTTKVTISPGNIRHLADNVVWLFEGLGLETVFANPVFEDVWEARHARIYHRELIKLADWLLEGSRRAERSTSLFSESIGRPMPPEDDMNWCGGTGLMLCVGTDGSLYPCLRYMSHSLSSGRAELKIGHVDAGIGSTPEEAAALRGLRSITRRSQSPEKCLSCQVASGCAWCSAHNYDVFGTAGKRATFICMMHKARVLANHYLRSRASAAEGRPAPPPPDLDPKDVAAIAG